MKTALLVVMAVVLVGCNSTRTTTTKQLDADGKVKSETVIVESIPTIADKSYNVLNQTTAFRVKSTPDTASASTSWLELIFGTSVSIVQMVAPVRDGEVTPVSYTCTKQTSIWADIFGSNVSSGTETYVGASDETADDTVKRLEAFRNKGN
jgi:hypothetical protein